MRFFIIFFAIIFSLNSMASDQQWLCQGQTLKNNGQNQQSQVVINPQMPEAIGFNDDQVWISSESICGVDFHEANLSCQTQDQSMALVQKKRVLCSDQQAETQVEAHLIFAPGTQNGRIHCRHEGRIWSLELSDCQQQPRN